MLAVKALVVMERLTRYDIIDNTDHICQVPVEFIKVGWCFIEYQPLWVI